MKQISEETATRCAFALKHETVKDCRCSEIPALEKQNRELVEFVKTVVCLYPEGIEKQRKLLEALAGKE